MTTSPFARLRGRRRLAIAVVVVIFLAVVLWWTLVRKKVEAAPAPPAVPATVVAVATREQPVWLTAVGTVQSLNVVNIRARVDGELRKIDFVEGQDVRAGDVLAQIDPRPFQAQLRQAEANLQKDQAQLGNSKTELARYRTLADLGAAPTQNVDTLKSQTATLEASLASDRAQIETVRLQLGYSTLVSPINGRAGFRQVDRGAMVRASDATGIVTITQMKPIAVGFSLSQDDLPELLARTPDAKLTVQVSTRDGRSRLAEGELGAIDNQVDTTTGQIRAKALFANDDGRLWPGELVSIRMLVRTDRHAVVVPSQAVLAGLKGNYVYVVKEDRSVEARPIEVGPVVDGFTTVRSGLASGERVVSEGQSRLAPGRKVAPKDEASGKAATS